MNDSGYEASALKTWLIILLLVVIVLVQGSISFFVVKDRGQPDWDYRPIKDVPGESPYALYAPLPYSQHIKGRMGE
jgi:hypothetical protein